MAKNPKKYEKMEEEEMCETCGKEYKPVKEAKSSIKSLSKAERMQMQDEYDMEDEKNEEDTEDTEDTEEMEEGYSKKMTEEDEEEMEDEEDESMKESIEAIFSGENLTEGFKVKAATLFEAAVNSRVRLVEEQLASKFTELLESQVEEIANDLTEKVDSYLNYVISEWMEENKLAVESGIRTEISESFIEGLRGLFLEHNISVPEGQTDLLDETALNLKRVSEQLNRQIQKTVGLTEQLKVYQRAEIFANLTEGLSDTQTERLRTLAENMEYADTEEFEAKLNILKENYLEPTKSKKTLSSIQVEDTSEPQTLTEASGDVSAYLNAMLRKNK